MTPDEAETVYYAEYGRISKGHDQTKPLVQKELRMHAWQAVIDAVRADYAREIAGGMLTGIAADVAASQAFPRQGIQEKDAR
jgi:hypothetical protein